MKSFLKPSLLKIILTIVLFLVASYLWQVLITSRITDIFPLGFPLPFYMAWGPCQPDETCYEFNGLWLFLDIVIWYVVSAFIIFHASKRNWQNEPSTK